jgi:AcrR family transcriptional regulator
VRPGAGAPDQMAADRPDAEDREPSHSGAAADRRPRALPERRARRRAAASPVREQIMAATLAAVGERGYRRTRVADVLARYGGYRVQFYENFTGLEESYAEAHAAHAELLADRLLRAGAAAPSWREGLLGALEELGEFACEDPLLARGLVVEVQVAAGPPLAGRQKVLERLSRAVDGARRETGSRHSPPPLTAGFMVCAIEARVVSALAGGEPERFAREAPELERLVSSAYF